MSISFQVFSQIKMTPTTAAGLVNFLTHFLVMVTASSKKGGETPPRDETTPHDETTPSDESDENGHLPGGLPMISDSAFSLLILIYVSIAFCFVFFMFCWKTDAAIDTKKGLQRQCVLMTNNLNEADRKKREAKMGYVVEDTSSCVGVIPPTPTPPHMSKVDEEDEETSPV